MEGLPDVSSAITALTVIAGFALLVERAVEALKHLINAGLAESGERAEVQARERAADPARVRETRQALEALQAGDAKSEPESDKARPATPEPTGDSDGDLAEADELAFENMPAVAVKAIPVPDEQAQANARLRLFYLLSAFGLSLLITGFMELHLLSLLLGQQPPADGETFRQFIDEFLTAVVIAGGSQPVHLLLRFLTTRRPTGPAVEAEAPEGPEAAAEAKPAKALQEAPEEAPDEAAAAGWAPITYEGGVKPVSLENRNRRAGNPNLIVYHHTAMPSDTGFQAVVDEFLVNKGWSTGYHCVIMPDGAIRPFCRWDRVGNHTKGLNNRSLGIAFHGNFHTDPDDPFGNPNGRFGNTAPTEAQIEAGARLIALWAHVYDIPPDFAERILPHREAKPGHTVCPGSNFPQQRLENRVSEFYKRWAASQQVRARIEAFTHKPYLYVA